MIKKSLHIILAILLLISTSGFSISTHFCQNQLQDLQFFCQAKTCSEIQAKQESCHQSSSEQPKSCKKGCCESKSDFYQLDLDQQTTTASFKSLNINALFAIIITFFHLDTPTVDKKSTDYLNYKPPLLVCDYSAELQTFLL